MKRQLTSGLAVAVSILVLSACSLIEKVQPVTEVPSEEFDQWSLVLDGERVDDLRADPEKIKAKVRELLKSDPWSDDKARKSKGEPPRLDEEYFRALTEGRLPGTPVPEALKGIGGFSARGLLRAADGQRQVITGKIRDYVYDDSNKSGHLAVDTRVEIFATRESFVMHKPDVTLRYHWDIEIEPGAFEVQKHSGEDLDPFPGTEKHPVPVEFTDATLKDIKKRGLIYKLFAKGEKIVVRHIYQVFDDGSIERLPNKDPLYESTEESCIDIMFDRFPPAIDLPPQRGYCLGRCDQPQVVNTGA